MKIGIIGAGMIGGTLGRLWLDSGYEVRYGTRHPDRVSVPGAASGTVAAAAAWAEVLVISIPLGATPEVARAIGAAAAGKVILDTGNVIAGREPAIAAEIEAGGQGSGVWVARHFPGARLVKAFNTVYFQVLKSRSGDREDPLGIPLASDDTEAMELARRLVADAGFEAVPVGALAESRRFDAGTPVWNSGAGARELRRHFAQG